MLCTKPGGQPLRLLFFSARLVVCAAIAFAAAGCGQGDRVSENAVGEDRKVQVVSTTTMITDMVRQVGGDRVVVHGLMGPGVDPHLYKATPSDNVRLRNAQVVFYNGLFLEGKIEDVLKQMARTKKHVYAITSALSKDQLLQPGNSSGHPDPHVWFDVSLWSKCVQSVVDGLCAFDPQGSEYYRARGKEYSDTLARLETWVHEKTSELPEPKRVLITSHDAFSYFGKAYGFRVVAIQGISTVTEPSLSDIVAMTEFIKKHSVKAVFVESSVPHKMLERVSQDAGVTIGGELFSDATGTPGEMQNGYDVGTYEGMIRHNINTIVEALK